MSNQGTKGPQLPLGVPAHTLSLAGKKRSNDPSLVARLYQQQAPPNTHHVNGSSSSSNGGRFRVTKAAATTTAKKNTKKSNFVAGGVRLEPLATAKVVPGAPASRGAFSPHKVLPSSTTGSGSGSGSGMAIPSIREAKERAAAVLAATESRLALSAAASPAGAEATKLATLKGKSLDEVANWLEEHRDEAGFVYMRTTYARSHVRHHAYDLTVCTHAETDKSDYYTLSAGGLSQVFRGTTVFTPMTAFRRELANFHACRKLHLIGHFRQWKAFTTWRRNVVRANVAARRERLGAELFLLNAPLRDALLRVRALCLDVVEARLCSIDPKTTYTLVSFADAQQAQIDAVTTRLETFRASVAETTYAAARAALDDTGFTEALDAKYAEDATDQMAFTDQARKRTACARLTHFVRLVDILVANAMQALAVESIGFLRSHLGELRAQSIRDAASLAAELAAAEGAEEEGSKVAASAAGGGEAGGHKKKTEAAAEAEDEEGGAMAMAPLPAQVQVVEYAGDRARVSALEGNGADKKVKKRTAAAATKTKKWGAVTEPAEPLLALTLKLSEDAIVIEPSLPLVQAEIERIASQFQAVVGVEALLTDQLFAPFTAPTIGDHVEKPTFSDGVSLESMFAGDQMLKDNINGVLEHLDFAFGVSRAYADSLVRFRDLLCENNGVDRTWLAETEHAADFFGANLTKYRRQIEDVSAVADASQVGPARIEAAELKSTFSPSAQAMLDIIKRILPAIAARKNTSVMERIDSALEQVRQEPSATEEHVAMLDFLEGVEEFMATLDKDAKDTGELYDLIENFALTPDPTHLAEYQTQRQAILKLRDEVKIAVEAQAGKVETFCDVLDKDISGLGGDVLAVREMAQDPIVADPKAALEDVLKFTAELKAKMDSLQERAALFKGYQKRFRLEVTRFSALEETHAEVKAKAGVWETAEEWESSVDTWRATLFSELNAEDLTNEVNKLNKRVFAYKKLLPENEVVPQLQTKIEVLKDKLPVITDLKNPALMPRHWEKINELLGEDLTTEDGFSIARLDEINAWAHADALVEISGGASSEASLEGMLNKMENNWKTCDLPIVTYRPDVYILGGLDDVQVLLDDSQVTVGTISGSRHAAPIRSRVDEWERKLKLFASTLEEWLVVQRNWLYLESIFSAPDIQRQLPTEAKMFLEVDRSFKEAMRKTNGFPNAIRAGCTPGFLEMFQRNNQLLDQIQKCLEDYLESKRMVFSRFFFLSNDELLEILAQTRNPQAVQPHMRKCFDAIQKLEFGAEGKTANDILAMISPEGERVSLGKGLKARGNVEVWLCSVEEAMVKNLYNLHKAAIADFYEKSRPEWTKHHSSQVIISVSQIMYNRDVLAAFDAPDPLQGLRDFEAKCKSQLKDLATLSRSKLQKLYRKVLGALITIDVHARDIISDLIAKEVTKSTDFEWVRQLRYFWDEEIDDCVARMSNSRYVYAYEYLGASMRLVITPLTDRCYLCLMGALQLDLGGAPAGPAGTGKTETVKDMAKAVGTQCVVFNCSEGLDFRMMGKFFSGLAQSGAWCCFDEFNRIDIEVLSVIAQQLLTIRNAKAIKAKTFMFEGREIRLIPKCAVFITMNPGYAGRTELPDNLKALFRPMAMMVPDYGLIAEVILFGEGFEDPRNLARKMVQMYKLCSEQLSQQDHYDFGMRAVKSVLVMAGSLKRSRVGQAEASVLLTALRDSNLPKFLAEDCVLFRAILSDLFPGVHLPDHDYGVLKTHIEDASKNLGLQELPLQVSKVIQLYETMVVRHGVMLVGPTCGGKTTCYQILRDALTSLHGAGEDHPDYQPVNTFVMNPKAVSMGELYGEVDPATTEWRDGLMATAVRQFVSQTNDEHKWIVCDGPVDALWIENMNTVLDDNKMLCLANSERIKLTPSMHMLFEVQDLAVASPATVSRCGMVYVDPVELGWRPAVVVWLRDLPEDVPSEAREKLQGLFDEHVPPLLKAITKGMREGITQVDFAKAQGVCVLLKELLCGETSEIRGRWTEEGFKADHALVNLFFFALVWGVGGNLMEVDMEKFDELLRAQFEDAREIRLAGTGTVFDFFVNFESNPPQLAPWDKLVKPFTYSDEVAFFDMLVPTVYTTRYSWLLERCLNQGHSCLFTGTTGVGKSVVAKDTLDRLEAGGEWVPVTMNFSAQTSSLRTQVTIESKLERKRKTVLGAPPGKKLVLFVDDLNMPKLEEYGAQPPIELLRQFQDFKGFYDRDKLFWVDVQDVTLVAACAPPGGGRNPVTPRFTRHFSVMCMPAPDNKALSSIFVQITKGFFVTSGFSKPIQGVSEGLVKTAVDIYSRMSTDLLPTPAKSHYVFNLRDLSKCVQGVLQADPSTTREVDNVIELFWHESLRVFHDRLINKDDKDYFCSMLSELSGKHLGKKVDPESFIESPIVYGDYMRVGAPASDRSYERIDLAAVPKVLEDYLDDYNMNSSKEMKLVFFEDAIQHVSRIARMVRQPRGNALLVGVGGTGKQSLTRMACHMAGYNCIQIEISRGYGLNEFREDLLRLYESAGSKNENTVFLFTDTQIVVEEFLEDINNILNSGEVPNLIPPDEMEKYIGPVRAAATAAGSGDSRDAVYQYFINRVRDNLHLVICMSPVGDAFRTRCRMFPSLVNCCTIDWFTEWPRDALLGVARRFFEFVDFGRDDLKASISEMCVEIHLSVSAMAVRFDQELRRKYYTTPTSYLELINLYTSMLDDKKRELVVQRDRFQTGLDKLGETNELVAVMKVELTALEPELKQKSEDTSKLMAKLQVDQAAADDVRITVQQEESVAKKEAAATKAIQTDAQRDLDEALPALDAATAALDALDKKDIQEIKSFATPPEMVQFCIEAVCILFKRKTDWKSAKQLLNESDLMNMMKQYDKDNIPNKMVKLLNPYVKDERFTPELVGKVSLACKSMCMWVRAMHLYANVFRTVEPKRAALAEAQTALDKTMASLKEKQKVLKGVEDKIADLQAMFTKSVNAKEELERSMQETKDRLMRAGQLITALGDEAVRWAETVEIFNDKINAVTGNVFLAAACVAYYGAFTSSYRRELVDGWVSKCGELNIPVSENMNVAEVLSSPYEIRGWNAAGLPRDTLSTENAVLVTQGRRWPLMIDPQDQANNWIRQMEGKNGLQIIKLTDPNFLRTLENAIRIGQPVLLEEVQEMLDPSLEPILLKQTFKSGGRLLIRLGDSDIDYDRNFRFYMTSKMSNPHYLPEICIKVTIINFTVTKSGLEDQLLADVVRLERPDLEEQRTKLILQINEDKGELKALEDKILKLLFNSKGNILDDVVLIETLQKSKVTSGQISVRLEQAEKTELSITEAREKYRPVSINGSVLFFAIADMGGVDPMYQYSLEYFKKLFVFCIAESEKDKDLSQRLANIIEFSTYNIFQNISRGLFERHKLMFSFLLCVQLQREAGHISTDKWNYFLRGAAAGDRERPPKPEHEWLKLELWERIVDLEEAFPDTFGGLSADVAHAPLAAVVGDVTVWAGPSEAWEGGAASPSIDWGERLDLFDQLMLVKTLADNRVTECTAEFVTNKLGKLFVESAAVEMAELYKDMTTSTPLIFVLSVGSDPMAAFQRFARDMNYSERIHAISLGQGQGPVAERLISKATKNGDWVFLQNCHLAQSWMTSMEMVIKGLADPKAAVHDDFRLFLSSGPCSFFPVGVLQNAVKVTNEPPKGLRANLRRAFAGIPQDFFEEHPKGNDWRKLIFGLCFFHAIIQERKKFGALGWNIRYEFNASDRECALETLKIFLAEPDVPWDAMSFVTGEITYGGRVTDSWDERCITTILKRFFAPNSLDDGYKYSASGIYYPPSKGTVSEFVEYISTLPFSDEPEIFGMHENANIAFQREETNALIGTILAMQPRMVSSGSGKSQDEIVFELAEAIEEKLPKALLDLDDAKEGTFELDDKGQVRSLSTVLRQEVDRFNGLLEVLWASLKNIKKAIKGFVVMSDELERIYTCFINNQVPELWGNAAYPSLKPLGSWVNDLVLRLAFISSWLVEGQPKSFWLPGFYFPQSFMTGTLQAHARKYNAPIDTLRYRFTVHAGLYISQAEGDIDQCSLPDEADGVFVHGVFMDACRWDDEKGHLEESLPGQMQAVLPVVHMLPAENWTPPEADYIAPMYKTSVRAGVLSTTGHSTNFVVAMHVPSAQPRDHWVSRGAALLTQLDT